MKYYGFKTSIMMKVPLGLAIIQWKSGGYSQAVFYQDHEGKVAFQCANWLPVQEPIYLSDWESQIKNVITEIEYIYDFLVDQ